MKVEAETLTPSFRREERSFGGKIHSATCLCAMCILNLDLSGLYYQDALRCRAAIVISVFTGLVLSTPFGWIEFK